MNYPRITIITPSFNQGQYLEQTILSVLEQQYPNLEYMVIDGGSTDLSVEIIKKHQDHLTFWVSEKDLGQAHAINKGLKKATGEIISWLNSDDFLQSDSLFSVARNFKDSSVNCVIGKIEYFDEKGPVRKSRNVVKWPVEKTIGSGVIPQPAMYFRKSCYDTIGLLDEKLYLSFDAVWYMQYLFHYGIEHIKEIPETLVHFRFHDQSKTMNNSLGYHRERSSICYSIAKQLKLHSLMDLLEMTNEPDKSYHFEIPEILPGISIEKAMNYFVFLLANEYYALSNHKKATLCFKEVKPYLLDEDTRRLFNKLYFRNSYIPHSLIKIIRKSLKKNK